MDERASISVVARRDGVAPNLLTRWRRLMLEDGSVAVTGEDEVTSSKLIRDMLDPGTDKVRTHGMVALTDWDRKLLAEHLDLYRALANGTRPARTKAQQHFVAVFRDGATPRTKHEIAYHRYLRAEQARTSASVLPLTLRLRTTSPHTRRWTT